MEYLIVLIVCIVYIMYHVGSHKVGLSTHCSNVDSVSLPSMAVSHGPPCTISHYSIYTRYN